MVRSLYWQMRSEVQSEGASRTALEPSCPDSSYTTCYPVTVFSVEKTMDRMLSSDKNAMRSQYLRTEWVEPPQLDWGEGLGAPLTSPSFLSPWNMSRAPGVWGKLCFAFHGMKTLASFTVRDLVGPPFLHLLHIVWFFSMRLGSQGSAPAKEAVQVAPLRKQAGDRTARCSFGFVFPEVDIDLWRCPKQGMGLLCHRFCVMKRHQGAFCRVFLC